MSAADPFTLDLFETTALASGWTLGASAVAAAGAPCHTSSTDDEKPTDEPAAVSTQTATAAATTEGCRRAHLRAR